MRGASGGWAELASKSVSRARTVWDLQEDRVSRAGGRLPDCSVRQWVV